MATETAAPGRLRRVATSPALLILLVAPFFGEGLSGSSPPLELLLPWNLAYMMALYGCGALVCREVAHRLGLRFGGLVLLGVAYAVWEEALVDRYWFFPQFWQDSGIGAYSVVWHTNVLLAAHLTVFHTAISICASVLVVEWLAPQARNRPWTGRTGLVAAGLVLAVTPVIYGEFDQRPPVAVLVAAGVLLVAIVAAAVLVSRRRRPVPTLLTGGATRPRRGLGMLAFAGVAGHWILTYTVAGTGLVWPVGVALSLLPVAAGLVLVPRLAVTGPYGSDGVRVVVGLLSFFVLLDLVVALLGRYDMILVAILTAWLARRLHNRRTRAGF
uniref:hypothetical protein n=1 Tax=Paractinoplanes polyasparticus TaxID=2856853 RepID=UPI001C8435E5|nr:hypothetical protein [Actinoplanes polyasparticus]